MALGVIFLKSFCRQSHKQNFNMFFNYGKTRLASVR